MATSPSKGASASEPPEPREAEPAPARRRARQRRRPEERAAEILDAARRVFSARGYEGASMQEIARHAGVVEGTLYTYFESKRDLLFQVLRRFYGELIEDVEAGLRERRSTEGRIRFLIQRHLEAFTADLDLCRLVIREIRPDRELYRESVRELNRRYTAPALRAIEEGIERGELRPELRPATVRDLIYGSIEHAVWDGVFEGRTLDAPRLARELTSAILAGIARPRAPLGDVVERLEGVVERLTSLGGRCSERTRGGSA